MRLDSSSFNTIAGYALVTEIVTEVFNVHSSTGDLKQYSLAGAKEDTIISSYGGFCFRSPRTPLVVGSKITTLHLPPGQHTIVFYTYFNDFNIDLTVNIKASRCTGIVNICKTCSKNEAGS